MLYKTPWRLSPTLAHYLCAILLIACMDVETNPGPDSNNEELFQFMDWRFTQMMNLMQMTSTNISRFVEEKFTAINETFRRFETGLEKLNHRVKENSECVEELFEDRESIFQRLDKLEEKMEATEKETKRRNLKFFGIVETKPGEDYTSTEQIVDVLNFHSQEGEEWQTSDIEQAFRLGRAQYNSREPRPLLVQFCHVRDKMEVLRNKRLRDRLRSSGIKVTAELTTRQKELIDFHREQGKNAYFWNGRLHIKDRPPFQARYKGPAQESQNNYQHWSEEEDFSHEKWPDTQSLDHRRDYHSAQRGRFPSTPPEHGMHTGGYQDQQKYTWRENNTDWRPRREDSSHGRGRENGSPEWYRYKDNKETHDDDPTFFRSHRIPERQVFIKRTEIRKKNGDTEDSRKRIVPVVPGHKSYSEAVQSGNQAGTIKRIAQCQHSINDSSKSRRQDAKQETAVKERLLTENLDRHVERHPGSLARRDSRNEDTCADEDKDTNTIDSCRDVPGDQSDPACTEDNKEIDTSLEPELAVEGSGQTEDRNVEDVDGVNVKANAVGDNTINHIEEQNTGEGATERDPAKENVDKADVEAQSEQPEQTANKVCLLEETEDTDIVSSNTTEGGQPHGFTDRQADPQQSVDGAETPPDSSRGMPRKRNPSTRALRSRKTSQPRRSSQGSIVDSFRRVQSADRGKDTGGDWSRGSACNKATTKK